MARDTKRNRDIIRRRSKGQTWRAIAAAVGLSRERVRQIVNPPPRSPFQKFRLTAGRHLMLEWCAGHKVPPHWIGHYCRAKDIVWLIDRDLIKWNGEVHEATELGLELLKWRKNR